MRYCQEDNALKPCTEIAR